jgi:preprotein translocase subunit SecA
MTDREMRIERAATMGRVTLLTRTFGRGVDFVCRDQQLLANGGIHVLQTFFSEQLSEEYQIMGRGARQGDKGSYRMILLDKDLEWVLGSSWKEELLRMIGSNLYQALNNAARNCYEIKCVVKHLKIEQCRCEHRESIDFMFALCTGEIQTVKLFLTEQNQGANSSRPFRLQFCS